MNNVRPLKLVLCLHHGHPLSSHVLDDRKQIHLGLERKLLQRNVQREECSGAPDARSIVHNHCFCLRRDLLGVDGLYAVGCATDSSRRSKDRVGWWVE